MAGAEGGRAMALICLAVGLGILLPLGVGGLVGVLGSAALVGGSFFMVPGAVTSFSRKNLTPPNWGAAIALFTTVFSLGQIVGPVGAGWVTDLVGSADLSLGVAGLILLGGALIAALQRPLTGPT